MAIGTGDDLSVQELELLKKALDRQIWTLNHIAASQVRRLQFKYLRTRIIDKLAKAKRNKENTVTIPFEPTCQKFLKALTESGIKNDLELLDVRLGLEQILDDPDYRAEATHRWASDVPAFVEVGPDSALERFLLVSPRHRVLNVDAVRVGLEAIVDAPEFKSEAEKRWARWDASPWPLDVVDDLGADDSAVVD